jgi:histidyl-tRNA synthetase
MSGFMTDSLLINHQHPPDEALYPKILTQVITMSQTLRAVRGTRDLLPPETALWNRIEATARDVFARYNFGEIRTPVFEDTALFARGVGEETDIVSKEMYTWEDGDRLDLNLLSNKWCLANEERFSSALNEFTEFTGTIPSGVNVKIFDGQHQDGHEELIVFSARPDAGALKVLASAVFQERAYFQGLGAKGKFGEVTGRLVYPSPFPVVHEETTSEGFVLEALYGIFNKSSQSLTLRPENTAGVVRSYIENKLGESGQLQKLYYIGPQFRRERPQKGRYRQFSQIGAEVIGPPSSGSESPLRDAEILEMLATLLDELGITGWTLELNSVGSTADRARYNEALRAALVPMVGQMCADCQRRAVTNPLRVLDCKVPADQPIIETLPVIADSLDEESRKHFAAVTAALNAAGVPYTLNHRLVRGLDYYTRTTFEFTHGGLGAQNALLGGGRYDGLSEMLGGPRAPGIGFAMGEDRLVLTLLAALNQDSAVQQKAEAFIAPLGESLNAAALVLARELRHQGLWIELGEGSFRLKKSFEAADKTARHIVILGEDELKSGILTVKNFSTGIQTKVPRAELAVFLAEPPRE